MRKAGSKAAAITTPPSPAAELRPDGDIVQLFAQAPAAAAGAGAKGGPGSVPPRRYGLGSFEGATVAGAGRGNAASPIAQLPPPAAAGTAVKGGNRGGDAAEAAHSTAGASAAAGAASVRRHVSGRAARLLPSSPGAMQRLLRRALAKDEPEGAQVPDGPATAGIAGPAGEVHAGAAGTAAAGDGIVGSGAGQQDAHESPDGGREDSESESLLESPSKKQKSLQGSPGGR